VSLARALARRMPRFPLRAERREVTFDAKLLDALRSGGSVLSAAGVPVTVEGSLRLSAVLGAVLLIADSLASVPLSLYERLPGGGRRVRADHPLHQVLHDLANPLMTAFDVRSTMLAHRLLYGNAYAEIEWDADGYPVALWPMDPQRVGIVMMDDHRLAYTYWSDAMGGVALPAWRVHHQRGLVMRGAVGLSPIRTAMNAIGLGLATEEFGARYFVNGAAPSVVLSHPSKLTPEATKNLRSSFEMQWAGLSNAHRIAVVGDGVKPELLSIPIEESQFLQSRQFQVKEIARIFKLPPGLLGETETATYASAEQEVLRFRELTLGPWAERFEKEIFRDLLTTDEQRTMFAQHTLAKLQATDLKTRFETYQISKNAGILTTNEVREMEDRNPVTGGDVLWMPLNMGPADQVAQEGTLGDGRRMIAPDDDLAPAIAAWLADTESRVRVRVANDVRLGGAKARRKGGADGLSAWVREQQPHWIAAGRRMLAPLAAVTQVDAHLVREWVYDEWAARRAELEGGDDVED
jgi:HK97 family phage portal protein